jgi:hypothetical protein
VVAGDSIAHGDTARGNTGARRDTSPEPRSPTKRDTIRIEGDPHPIDLTLLDAALFSTYYPSDMKADQLASGEGIGVRFTAAFGGVLNDAAFLHVFVPNDIRSDYRAMRDFLLRPGGLARSNGWQLGRSRADGPPPCQGAVESWPITAGSGRERQVGFACIGEYRGRGFIVIGLYPQEYEEGMGPRLDKIIKEFRWFDGGRLFGVGLSFRPLEPVEPG